MECNKDEALRAKEIAEKKFTRKDIAGAMKFALKARNLFPELDGLEQLIATFDVHFAAEKQVNGEPDWYGVLGVDPKADDESVRRQYRKLALLLHPDKNKAVGGDGAFKLLSQAWSLLSDKDRRTAYDQNNRETSQKVPKPSGASSGHTGGNGFHNSAKSTSAGVKSQKAANRAAQHPPNKPKQDTFWTVCHRCKMQYEYLRVYQNHNLLCPNCHGAFFAIEVNPPKSSFSQQKGPSQAAQRKVKRERDDSQAAIKRREDALRRKNAAIGLSASGQSNAASNGKQGSSQQKKDENGLMDFQNKMMKKARVEIHRRLNEAKLANAAHQPSDNNFGKSFDDKENHQTSSIDESNFTEPSNGEKLSSEIKLSPPDDNSGNGEEPPSVITLSMDVLTSDFHDFNTARTENSFAVNQVWAVYDCDDGMPRHYVMIRQVVSLNPFKVKISWLNPLGLLNPGFLLKTCGDFQEGRVGFIDTLDSFSHKVRASFKDASVAIHIFPRKGDVWAMYKNWSRNWNELTPEEEMHKYEVVEVLEDFDEQEGLIIIPLVKVAGFRTLFHQNLDFREIREIPKEEMSRFSHYIPSFLHLGHHEAPSTLRGCRELDPAATPQELLQVIAVETAEEEETIAVEEEETIAVEEEEIIAVKEEEIIAVEEKNEQSCELHQIKGDNEVT